MILNPYAIVIDVYATLGGKQPGATSYADHKAYINANGQAAYLTALEGMFATQTNATMSATILANLGLASIFTAAQGEAYLAANAGNRVKAALDLASALTNYVSDATNTNDTAILAAKTTYVATTANAYTYASNSANTSDAATSAAAVSTGQTFTLTTSVESYGGTTGDDVVNGSISATAASNTLNSFDAIAGGAGNDTLNIIDNVALPFAMPASATISGFETVNLSRAAIAGGANTVAVTDTTFGTGVKTLNVLEAGLGTTSTASVTLASATDVSVKSTGIAFTTVAITDTSATAALTGSTLTTATVNKATGTATLTGNAINTVNLNAVGGLTTVTAAAGTRDLTVNTSGTTTHGGVTDATATSLTINNSGVAALGTFTAAKATTINYSSTAANTSATITGAVATTLNVGGTKLATLALAVNPALTTINVTGAAGLTLTAATNAATDYAALTLIDTSGSTGVLTANTLGTGTAVTGGAGNDNITVGATTKAINLGGSTAIAAVAGTSNAIEAANKVTLASGTTAMGSGGTINGGTGSADILSMVAADAATLTTAGAAAAVPTAFRAAVTGFETLELAAAGADLAVDKKAIGTTFNKVALTGDAQTVTLNNIDNNDTVQVTGANTAVTLAGSSGSGVDTLNIKLVNTGAALAAFGTFTTPNTETVVITSTDAQVTPVGYYNSMTLVDASASSITVNGNSGLDLTFAGTALTSFDASGVTLGGVKFTSGAQSYATDVKGTQKGGDTLNFNAALAAVTMSATAGTNTLTGSNTVASTITGGSGADTIYGGSGADTIVGGAGADIIVADNAGTKAVAKFTITAAATTLATDIVGATVVLNIFGTDVTATFAATDTTATLQADKITAAINASSLNKLAVASNVAGAMTLTSLVDGTSWAVDATAGTATGLTIKSGGTAVDTAMTIIDGADASAVAQTVSTSAVAVNEILAVGSVAGTLGTSGKNVITGGTGSDTFVFGAASTTPSSTTFHTITDFASASDSIDYSALPLTIVTNATASAGTAAISAAGIATFAAGDSTLALRIVATEAGIQAGTATAGQVAVFQFDSDAYVFISNGVDGVGAGDQLIKLTGVSTTDTAFDTITLANGNMTLA